MATKRKTSSTPRRAEEPTIESLAEQLRAQYVDPGWVLYAALEGEKLARGKRPAEALRADPRALYAPTVLAALVEASLRCQTPHFGATFRPIEGLAGLFATDLLVKPTTEWQRVILEASTALRSPGPGVEGARAALRVTEDLRLALRVQAVADEIAEARALEIPPAQLALRRVAKENGLTPAALKKRIERSRKSHPGDVWPKKKARRL